MNKFLMIYLIFYLFLLISTLNSLPFLHDEPVHATDSVFYFKLISDTIKNPSTFFQLKEYVTNFYSQYPVLYLNEYPPLISIFPVTSYFLFGISEFSSRLFIPVISIFALLTTYKLGKELYNENVGIAATLMLSTIPYFFSFSKMLMLEIPLVFFLNLSFIFFYMSLKNKKYLFYFLITTIIAFYLKYTIAIVYISVFLFFVWTKTLMKNLKSFIIILLIFMIFASSYILLTGKIVGESYTVGLFTGKYETFEVWDLPLNLKSNIISHIFFFPLHILFNIPLVILLFFLMFLFTRSFSVQSKLLLLWIIVFLLFFTFSINKTPKYIISIFPPIVLLASYQIFKNFDRKTFSFIIIVIILLQLAYVILFPSRLSLPLNLKPGTDKIGFDEIGKYVGDNLPKNSSVLLMGGNYGWMCYDCALTFSIIEANDFQNNVIRARDCIFLNFTDKDFYGFLNENNVYYIVGFEKDNVYDKFKSFLTSDKFDEEYSYGYLHAYRYLDVDTSKPYKICNFNCKLNKNFCYEG